MKARALVQAVLRGEKTDRYAAGPLAVHFCARQAGISLREYTLDPHKLAEAIIAYWETFRPDAVWVSSDTWVTAEAMGAPVAFTAGDTHLCGTGAPAITTLADLERLPPPDPLRQGRQPLMLAALREVCRKLGEETFVVGCFDQSPFSLACAVGGVEKVMAATLTAPEFLTALLDRCTAYTTAYAEAMAACGPDMLSTGDSPVIMLGADLYARFGLPYEQQVFHALRTRTDCFLSLHNCGDTTAILPGMIHSGAGVLEVDHLLDLEGACRLVPPDLALWGNIDPVDVLCYGGVDDVSGACHKALDTAASAGRGRFVLSSGCTLAPETPAENVLALIRAVHERSL
ncbi:MAG: uroporphyrinogen decarboxylase family protein [Candidatus Hydrogenedentes bacterium]|nr:uroporphyrinogen decarboxylase family protein [Candidatus Hydrogenedentota bacterium]